MRKMALVWLGLVYFVGCAPGNGTVNTGRYADLCAVVKVREETLDADKQTLDSYLRILQTQREYGVTPTRQDLETIAKWRQIIKIDQELIATAKAKRDASAP